MRDVLDAEAVDVGVVDHLPPHVHVDEVESHNRKENHADQVDQQETAEERRTTIGSLFP